MEDLVEKDFKEFIQKDIFSLGSSYKTVNSVDFLFHYTNINALNSILEKNTLWITKADYLNDITEYQYTERLIQEILKQQEVEEYIKVLVDKIIDATRKKLEKSYILSLSNNNDSLALWSNYTRFEGYNFGINLHDFEKLIYEGTAKIITNNEKAMKCIEFIEDTMYLNCEVKLDKVIYDVTEQTKLILEVIESANSFYIKHSNNIESNGTIVPYIHHIVSTLFSMFIFFKNPCFESEEEYRMVFIMDNDEYKEDGIIHHRISNGAFVPFIKLKFDENIPISSIKIGPRNNADISIKGMKSLMKSRGYNNIDVKKSNIPLRY